MEQDAEIKQLQATVEVHKGLKELAEEVSKLRANDPEFAEMVRRQFLRIISHIESEQRSRVTHGTYIMEHHAAIERHRKILEGTAEQEGVSVFVKKMRRGNSYVLTIVIGLAVKALWDVLLRQ